MGCEARDDTKGLGIPLESILVSALLHQIAETFFGDMAKRGMAKIMGKRRSGSALRMRTLRLWPMLRRRSAP
jgi:5'-deoxynucleotidase YfbR-like HD superfamily hydrolase